MLISSVHSEQSEGFCNGKFCLLLLLSGGSRISHGGGGDIVGGGGAPTPEAATLRKIGMSKQKIWTLGGGGAHTGGAPLDPPMQYLVDFLLLNLWFC